MMSDEKKRGGGRRLLWLGGAALVVFLALASFRRGPDPTITVTPGLPGIGRATPVTVVFEEPVRGLGELRFELVQGERVELLAEVSHTPRPAWAFWGPRTPREELEVVVGRDSIAGLAAGEAVLRASARPAGAWLRSPDPVVREVSLPVRLTPPVLEVVSIRHYVAPGGSGVVVYRAGTTSVKDGVVAGGRWFEGFDLPGGQPGDRFALFGVPFDLANPNDIVLAAEDDVGNRATTAFVDRLFERAFETDTIRLSDAFLEKVVPPIMDRTPGLTDRGGLLENYLQINGELRARNARTLEELAASSRREFLWNSAFQPMPNTAVMSSFADRRTYVYEGREVDHQDHLGYDQASVRRAEVPAANSGVVALARFFGIYGNAVVVDHGFGLMSLYGHLSTIDVAEGQPVERGQVLGRSGETGLAGGDHLHFTMLLAGLPVDPVEWWDAAWIRDRVAAKLGPVLPFED